MAFIIVEKGSNLDIGKRYTLKADVTIIGRASSENNPDIVLQDDYVSRRHIEIICNDNSFMLRDLESKNGTKVNGRRIEPSKLYPLTNDTSIGLGITQGGARVLLRFKESPTTATVRVYDTGQEGIFDWLSIDKAKKEIWVDSQLISLSPKEFNLLSLLYSKARQVCTRDEIITSVWPEVKDPGAVSDATIDQLIHRLREKIEPDISQPKRLVSKKGFGYILL